MHATTDLRVAHVIGALVAGGAERFVVSLLRSLKHAGHCDVQLWVMSNRMDDAGMRMRDMLSQRGIPCVCGPEAKVGLGAIGWYAKLVNRQRPDIVHLHTPNTELLHYLSGFIGRKSVALSRTLHNTQQPTGRMTLTAYRRNKVKVSIACSEAAAMASGATVAGDLTTITNGVEFDYPIRDAQVSALYKGRLGLDVNVRHFVHIGRMAGESLEAAQKAHDVVIKAWLESGLGTQGCQLHLLGGGTLRAQLEDLACMNSSVRFHGVRQDATDWLVACDCFLMPSRFEGMPMAGIEAVGAGLPCIFSDLTCLHELQPPAAAWVRVNDVQGLAQRMRQMAVSDTSVDTVLVEAFRGRFSISNTATRYVDSYASMMQAASKRATHATHG